jgi:hypothetical protein
MRRQIIVWVGVVGVAVAGTMACGGGPQPTTLVSIGVEGRSNSTPSVAAAGSFVAIAWGASAEGMADVYVAVSRDAGQTFTVPVQVNDVPGAAKLGGEFPPRVAVTPRKGSGDPDIAVLWTEKGDTTAIKTARSTDGGATFGAPTALQAPDAPGQRGWPALAMDGAGTAHTIWLDHRGMAAPAGAAAGAKHAGHGATDAAYDGVAMAQKSGLYYASAGAAPASERELAKGVCYCCKTAMTVTPDGAIHAAWRHVYAGNLRDIAATVSRDGGRTFSEPVRISEDGWEIAGCPDDGPAMAADESGTVHVIWPTMLDGPTPEGALFYSFTRDGVTFAPRTRIPTLGQSRPTHPQIAVDQQGRVMVAWDEFTSGMRMAAAREIKRPGTATIDLGPVVIIEPSGPSTYPALAGTAAGILGVWSTGGDTPAIAARTIPWQ